MMEEFVLQDGLKSPRASYLVRTIYDKSHGRIVSSIFREGSLIKTCQEEYNGDLGNSVFLRKIKRHQVENCSKIRTLFDLSKKLANSKELDKRMLLALVFMRYNMSDEALFEFEATKRLCDTCSLIDYYLGKIYLSKHQFDQAVLYFRKAVKMDEKFADYHFYLGKALLAGHKADVAIKEFIRAIELNSYYHEAYYYLGLSYLGNAINKQNYELAKEARQKSGIYFAKAMEIYPSYGNDYFVQAQEGLENGNLRFAWESFLKALCDGPKKQNQQFILDFHLKYLNDKESLDVRTVAKYVIKLEKLVKKYGRYADLFYELGIAYAILSELLTNTAIHNFQEALSINPNYTKAAVRLKRLKIQQQRTSNITN